MHPTTLLLLALSAASLPTTLSAPAPPLPNTTTNTTTHLSPRARPKNWAKEFEGWKPSIGSFTDASCTLKSLIPPPPSINKLSEGWGCIKFTPATDNVGLDWGVGARAESISFYTDEKCTNFATKKVYSPPYGYDNGEGKADKCVSYRETGGAWHSVGFNWPTGKTAGGFGL
ncbi:MAG: hypothetical protein LQ344_006153 [Seirophora lacunosa]|nr:MAG: hypothetical protein LQ344_006153 [Seirophora lacunosa]